MKPISRRKLILGATAAAAGCGRQRRAPDADSITILYIDDETALGPNQDDPAQFLMFLPLAVYNSRGEVEGRLAEHWQHSPDYRTWTIRLRDGIHWHDGTPVTAHDVKFTIDLKCHPDVLWWLPDSFEVRVIDDLTYTITRRENGFKETIWDDDSAYYPKHLLQHLNPKEFYSWDFWKQPIGNGPYRYVRHVPKTMTQLEANRDYYRGKPKIPKVVLKFGEPSSGGAVPELLSGDVDAATYVKRADVLKMSQDGRFRIYNQLRHSTVRALFWDHQHPLFREAKVRRALTLGINRRELLQALGLPDETPIVDAPLSRGQIQRREFAVPIPYNPELANRLLDEAGWGKRNRQGIRERDGMVFSFAMITSASVGAAAVYAAAQLRHVGVQANVTLVDQAVTNLRIATGDFAAVLWGIGGTSVEWTGEGSSLRGLRRYGYTSPRFLRLLEQFQAVRDPSEEDRLFRELTNLFQEEVPATFLHPDVLTTIATRRVRGLDECPYRGDATWCMDQLSLEGLN